MVHEMPYRNNWISAASVAAKRGLQSQLSRRPDDHHTPSAAGTQSRNQAGGKQKERSEAGCDPSTEISRSSRRGKLRRGRETPRKAGTAKRVLRSRRARGGSRRASQHPPGKTRTPPDSACNKDFGGQRASADNSQSGDAGRVAGEARRTTGSLPRACGVPRGS